MLQTSKTQTPFTRDPVGQEMPSAAETLRNFASFVRRQIPVIVFVTILALALGLVYCMTARPMFSAQAQLLIDARKLQVFQQQSILGDIPIDTAQVESQVEILKSESIAAAVVKNLHLSEDPEFTGAGMGLLGAVFDTVLGSRDEAASEYEVSRNTIRAFQSQLNIKRLGLTYVIQIGFSSHNAERAAQIANAVADAYIVDQLEAKYQATRRASVWLQDRIKELRDQVSNAERDVVEFQTQHNIVNTGGADKRLLSQQQVAELNSQLVIARAHTAETKARLDRIDLVLKAPPSASIGGTVADTLKSEVVSKLRSQYLDLAAREADWSARYGQDHLAVVNLRNQMREIRNAVFEELKRLGETYKSDYEIAKQREEGVQKELAQAVSQSQTTDVDSVALRQLQSSAQTYKTLYDNFLQRYMESVQQQSFPITEARLITSAARPLAKSSPKTLLVLAIATLGGMFFGVGIGMLRDISERVFRTTEQVEHLLQTPCIALVPLLTGDEIKQSTDSQDADVGTNSPKAGSASWAIANLLLSRVAEATRSSSLVSDMHGTIKSAKRKLDALAVADPEQSSPTSSSIRKPQKHSGARNITCNHTAFRIVVDAPFSRFSEAMRSIKLAVDLNESAKSKRVVGITSALPNEGKSTIAAAVAQVMSQVNARAILVDCDLRNPSLSRALAPSAVNGLLDVITKKVSLEDAIWKDPSTNMAFLPTVIKSRLAHSGDILSSEPVTKLFEQLRENYDYVVADFSPLAPIVDVRATTHLVNSFIFVIEWGRTKFDVVDHALAHARGIHENLLGVVLNKVDMNLFGRYASGHESYYYNKHYERYGYTE